ncbi:probable transcription factor At5g28040 [Vigna umbellata]|uniref:probable transcription factor At5g28040 n=1 Tax=Vigna umbellata TaxID=87088 RepID=UPI001F5FA834|nr:probable transcription factor At5g28040 [Vigna umbellata]
MLSPLVSWFLSPSSSSSSSEEEENLDINTQDHTKHQNHQNFNTQDDDNDQYLSSCDVDEIIPVALAVPSATPAVTVAFPADDDRSTVPGTTATATTFVTRSKGQCSNKYSGIVRQYQRLWTKQDEKELLKGYLDYIKQHGRTTTTLQNDVASLYDHVRPKLNVDFNKNQLVEKLRRLKRKHKLALNKGTDKEVPFRNPQEQAIFEISNKIWGNDTDILLDQESLDGDASGRTPESRYLGGNVKVKVDQLDNSDEIDERVPKRLRLDDAEDVNRTNEHNNSGSLQVFIEETMRSCFSPLLKEMLDEVNQEPPPGLVPIPLPLFPEKVDHGQWRKRGILELEVYLKRLELLQDQIKARLEELRSRREVYDKTSPGCAETACALSNTNNFNE